MTIAEDILAVLETEVQTYGRQVAFTSYAGVYSGATGINTRTPTTHTVWVFPPYAKRRFQAGDVQGKFETQYIVPNLLAGFVPTTSMKMVDGGVTHTIDSVEALEAESIVAWVLHLHQGGAT